MALKRTTLSKAPKLPNRGLELVPGKREMHNINRGGQPPVYTIAKILNATYVYLTWTSILTLCVIGSGASLSRGEPA